MLYELPSFEHVDATRVEEAASLLRTYGEKARIMAGGTDLLAMMKDRIRGPQLRVPEVLINVKSIPEMNRIACHGEGDLRIGAAVTLSELERSEVLRESPRLLREAARQVGTTQIRSQGTIGGNLCQRPRCLYFRHPDFICYKKGGATCHAIAGEHRYYHSFLGYGRCAMAHPSDLAPALIALGTSVLIASPEGEREIPLEDLYTASLASGETLLNSDELIREIHIPKVAEGNEQRFLKRRIRHAADFAISSVALFARPAGRVCEEIRIVVGGIAPVPWRASQAEEMIRGEILDQKIILRASRVVVQEARPLRMNAYKVELTEALVRRGLESIAGIGEHV